MIDRSANGPTMSPHFGVRPARLADIPDLVGILARAFADDPYMAYLTAGAAAPDRRLRAGWTAILRYASAGLTATYTTEDRTGVAVWLPPRAPSRSRIDSMRLKVAMARLRGLRRLRAVSNTVRDIDGRRRRHAPEPHYYLEALAVDVGRQGQGIGTALLAPILEQCDSSGLSASLETVNPRNLPFYERLGFAVVEEVTLPDAGTQCWLMLRTPRPADSGHRSTRGRCP